MNANLGQSQKHQRVYKTPLRCALCFFCLLCPFHLAFFFFFFSFSYVQFAPSFGSLFVFRFCGWLFWFAFFRGSFGFVACCFFCCSCFRFGGCGLRPWLRFFRAGCVSFRSCVFRGFVWRWSWRVCSSFCCCRWGVFFCPFVGLGFVSCFCVSCGACSFSFVFRLFLRLGFWFVGFTCVGGWFGRALFRLAASFRFSACFVGVSLFGRGVVLPLTPFFFLRLRAGGRATPERQKTLQPPTGAGLRCLLWLFFAPRAIGARELALYFRLIKLFFAFYGLYYGVAMV